MLNDEPESQIVENESHTVDIVVFSNFDEPDFFRASRQPLNLYKARQTARQRRGVGGEEVQSPEVEAEPVHMQAAGEQFMQPWRQVRQTHTHKWQSGQRHA